MEIATLDKDTSGKHGDETKKVPPIRGHLFYSQKTAYSTISLVT
jgi:hypothetical protein